MTRPPIDPEERARYRGHEGTLVGAYRIEWPIGRGGCGEVWEATHEVEGVPLGQVALKLIPLSPAQLPKGGSPRPPSGGAAPGWLDEVRALERIDPEECRSVTQVKGAGVDADKGFGFIAMELLSGGGDLEARLKDGPLYWRKALWIAREVAAAVAACHGRGVRHCDLKPRNVYVTKDDKRVCVLDFGLAALGAEVTRETEVTKFSTSGPNMSAATLGGDDAPSEGIRRGTPAPAPAPDALRGPPPGTPGYMAPEQYSRQTGKSVDVFALGVLLYRMIAGVLPHRLAAGPSEGSASGEAEEAARAYQAFRYATEKGHLRPIREAQPDLPAGVADLVDRLLQVDPAKRLVRGLREDLDEVFRKPYGPPATPYLGLAAFESDRAGYLAGREADIGQIAGRLVEQRGIALFGPSGCGKSSLAMAGVVPRLDERMLLNADGWRAIVVRPADGARRMAEVAARELARAAGSPKVGAVVLVDQLEEVLSLGEEAQRAFCASFVELAVGDVSRRLRVIATVRDDRLNDVAAMPGLARFFEAQSLYFVRGVEPNAVDAIVTEPARVAGVEMEGAAGVAAEAKRLVQADPSMISLVQFALTAWWDRRGGRGALTREGWAAIGGVEGSLATAAEGLYQSLSAEDQARMMDVLVLLFKPDGTKRRAREVDVPPASRKVCDELVARRLLRRLADSGEAAELEVTHEAVGRRWEPLQKALESTRETRALLDDVRHEAERWARELRPEELLRKGRRLSAVLPFGQTLEGTAKEFVDASQAAEQAEREAKAQVEANERDARRRAEEAERKRRLRQSGLVGLLVGALFAGVGYAGWRDLSAKAAAEKSQLAASQAELATTRKEQSSLLQELERARARNDEARIAADQAKKEADAKIEKATTDERNAKEAKRIADVSKKGADDALAAQKREMDKLTTFTQRIESQCPNLVLQ